MSDIKWRRTRVYIAGPLIKGDTVRNVADACHVWELLFSLGYAPMCPHWSMVQHFHSAHSHDEWINFDLEWLYTCDALLRLVGESEGADVEEEFAKKNGIPVYNSVVDLARNEPKLRIREHR